MGLFSVSSSASWQLSQQSEQIRFSQSNGYFQVLHFCPQRCWSRQISCITCVLRTETVTNRCYVNRQITHTHPFNGSFPGLPRWAGTRKVKPIWILLKQETVSGSSISWDICKSAPRSRQITTSAPHHSVFTSRMPFLPPNQQRQSTEGNRQINVTLLSNIKLL